MSDHKYWYQHDSLNWADTNNIVAGIDWMLINCPELFALKDRKSSVSPLKGKLISSDFIPSEDGAGGTWDGVVRLRHDGSFPFGQVCGIPSIVLNGHGSLGADFFVISPSETSKPQAVDTKGKPYELLVASTLLLAAHFNPGKWTISSTAPRAVWEAARDFIKGYLSDIEIPENIRAQWEPVKGLTVTPPAMMDYRA